jgi:transcriptional regulator with XRE-family HTH domain
MMERTINNLLAFLCDVDGFSQAEIADKIGISRSHISEIYSGKKEVSLTLLFEIAKIQSMQCLTNKKTLR